MKLLRVLLVPVIFGLSGTMPLQAYEWRAHHGLSGAARELAIQVAGDTRLEAFLSQNQGMSADGYPLYDLTTRAGDLVWDEDRREGVLQDGLVCLFVERGCWPSSLVCSFDHFSPQLPFPLATHDAVYHGRSYFDVAVRLYKAARCASYSNYKEMYERWSVRALGHAIHLVEDMGSPQHVEPEVHDGVVYAPDSFHEHWVEDNWSEPYTRPNLPVGEPLTVGPFTVAASARPRGRRNGRYRG